MLDLRTGLKNTKTFFFVVCEVLNEGSVAWFGSTSLTSMKMISQLAKKYRIPFFTWSQSNESKSANETTTVKRVKKNKNSQKIIFVDLLKKKNEPVVEEERVKLTFLSRQNNAVNSDVQIDLKPDLSNALYKLIEHFEWTRIYYIYNHEKGISKLLNLF
jgi:hypothetical protein